MTFTPITLNHPEFFATVTFREATSEFRLHWTDGVANEWTEEFPSLDMALGRLASLVNAVETDRTFTKTAEEFAAEWTRFAAEVAA